MLKAKQILVLIVLVILIILGGMLTYFLYVSASSFSNYLNTLNVQKVITEKRLYETEERLRESDMLDRYIKCQGIVDKFRDRYNNVTGGGYNSITNSCDIEFESNGKKQTADMDSMSDN
ncbi:MAG: hypothetical protein WC348_00750 [Patescibacteria group bacterium]|jgi:flagellar basal body-associated protein FliL